MSTPARDRLLAAIRRETVDRVPVAPRHYDPAFLIQALGLPGEPEYFMAEDATPELFRVGLAASRVSTLAALDFAEKTGVDPVFYKGVRLGLPPSIRVSYQAREDGPRTLLTSTYQTAAGPLSQTEKRYRDGRLQLEVSHGASPDRMYEHLIKGPGDLDRLAYIVDRSQAWPVIAADFKETLDLVGRRGLVFAEVPHPMMLAVEFYGLENFLIALIADSGFARELLALCNEITLRHIDAVTGMDAEVIYMDGVFSTPRLIAPAHFARFLSPLIHDYVSLLHKRGAYLHLFVDGPCLSVLSILQDLGVDLVSPMDPPPWGDADLAVVTREVGGRISYMGAINAPNDLATMSREQVVEQVKSVMAAAPTRGFILSTADSVQPGTPVDNYLAMIETALAFGICS